MSCSCKNTPKSSQVQQPKSSQTQPNQPSFLDIVKGNSVAPPNGTYKMRVQARVGEQIYKGIGLLTYTPNPDGSIEHYFQTNLDGPNAPFIQPLIGKGFLNLYEYQSHHNSHHAIHSFITNKLNVHNQDLDYHINADPASCCCCQNCCQTGFGGAGGACVSCNRCFAGEASGECGRCCSRNCGSC